MRTYLARPYFTCLQILLMACLLGGCGLLRTGDNGRASVKAQNVMRSAYSQMGAKYRLGGASPQKGFDCSGLIYWAYQNNGIKVPRITSDQAKAGQSVSRNNALVGDIVVLRTGVKDEDSASSGSSPASSSATGSEGKGESGSGDSSASGATSGAKTKKDSARASKPAKKSAKPGKSGGKGKTS